MVVSTMLNHRAGAWAKSKAAAPSVMVVSTTLNHRAGASINHHPPGAWAKSKAAKSKAAKSKVKCILDEENGDFAATSRRTFTSEEVIKQLLGIS